MKKSSKEKFSSKELSRRISQPVKKNVTQEEADPTIRPGQGKESGGKFGVDHELDNRANKDRNKSSHP